MKSLMLMLASWLLVCLLAISAAAQLTPREPKRVAIFLYQGVELLDFAGPGEVFSAAGFETYTLSVDGKELTSQRFVKIQPAYSLETAPVPDIVVFPGGSAGASADDARVMAWIKKLNDTGATFMSVCTGAFILGKAGLLYDKRVTTHWGSTKSLAKQLPSATVMEDTRFVDNGAVITTAGVSAGIDGALHLVSRIKGLDAAKATARYMEYDKWSPDNGVVDKKNEYLEILQAQGLSGKTISAPTSTMVAPYQGEFKNLAVTLSAKGEHALAARVLEEGIKLYPKSDLLYSELQTTYTKLGKPAPVSEAKFIGMLHEGKTDAALAQFEKDKEAFPGWRIISEQKLNDAGYYLMYEKNDIQSAIKVFALNVQEYPTSANVYDSLGEAYLKAGRKDEAIASYKKSLALDDTNENARKVLKDIGAI